MEDIIKDVVRELGKVTEVSQINVFKCSSCGVCEMIANHDVSLHEDPVIQSPEGWGYNDKDELCCSGCL